MQAEDGGVVSTTIVVTGVDVEKNIVYTNNPWSDRGEQTFEEFQSQFIGGEPTMSFKYIMECARCWSGIGEGDSMVKYKKYRAISVALLGLCITLGTLVILSFYFFTYNTESTTEYTTTIQKVKMPNVPTETVEIFVFGNEESLLIDSFIASAFSREEMQFLENAEMITFRIPNYLVEEYEKSGWAWIVELSVDNKQLFSMEEYSRVSDAKWVMPRIAGTILSMIVLGIGIFFGIKAASQKHCS